MSMSRNEASANNQQLRRMPTAKGLIAGCACMDEERGQETFYLCPTQPSHVRMTSLAMRA